MPNEFGALFRETRQALGLSLREFCRNSGFDQANVSRLERGLAPAPKSGRVLASYAKALKLKPKSAQWERFMTLAAAARLPDSLQVKHRAGQGFQNWVRAKNLEDWAGTEEARGMLPQLVRRLIRFSTPDAHVTAPAREQTQRPGWDVLAEGTTAHEFVPSGVSVWEMGVDKSPKKKADDDFEKRLGKTPGVTKRHTTFVFVTPRHWQKKEEWVAEKKKKRAWKNVLVYDSASLEEWLENAQAVDVWLARQLGLVTPGMTAFDDHWKNLEALTEPGLSAKVHLASRGDAHKKLRTWLSGAPDSIRVESGTPTEALDFVVAASREDDAGERLEARGVVVESRDAWRTLAGGGGMVLVAHPSLQLEPELVAEAVRGGHHVILCAEESSGHEDKRIKLPRVSGHALDEALRAQGVDRNRAADLARECGGSLTVLKRRAARHPGTVNPLWSRVPHAGGLVPVLLAGSWDDTSDGDRSALETLAGAEYRDVAALAQQWAEGPDPLVYRTPSGWRLVSRDDSWALVSAAITDDDLKRFETVALEVLGEVNPACDLPSNTRWQARVLGKERRYSQMLRNGLAESLALLAARQPQRKGSGRDTAGLAAFVVRKLFDGAGWKQWASLSGELPVLAEAAPDEVLACIDRDLAVVCELFDRDADPLWGPTYHPSVLWALEALAWDRGRVSRAARLLARLHEAVPGFKHGNNPMGSLTQVFMPWYPQTTATVEDRVKVISSIAARHPEAGWALLLGLLPAGHSTVNHNYRPRFRDWAFRWTEGTSRADYAFQVEACAQLVVETAAKVPARLTSAVEAFENFPPSAQRKLLIHLSGVDAPALGDDRRAIAETIRKKVARHRKFSHTEWALEPSVIDDLEKVRERLEPEDAVAKHAWLFGDYWKVRDHFERYDSEKLEETVDADAAVEQARAAALTEIRTGLGWDGVLALASAAEAADQVGAALACSPHEGDDGRVLPDLLTSDAKALQDLAKGYAAVRHHRGAWAWVRGLDTKVWSEDQLVTFAQALPASPELWDLVEARGEGAAKRYWKSAVVTLSKDAGAITRGATSFARYGRPFYAARQLGMARHRDVPLDPAVLASVLTSGLEALSDTEQQKALGHVQYDVKELIRVLQQLVAANDPRIEARAVAQLEWGYLDLLDGHPTVPETLHTWLENPEFFMEVIRLIAPRGQAGDEEPTPLSAVERARVVQAYRLLASWKRVPGSLPNGEVDEDRLFDWVRKAREAAGGGDLLELCDLKIGAVFAHAPPEGDGTRPCIPVRDAIEEFGTDAMVEGFEVAVMNERGAYWKSLDEGGDQERGLAQRFIAMADACAIEWPRTAAALRRIGERYGAQARHEDAEAEAR